MAIDQYKPELAKRRTAFQIAYEQLQKAMSQTNSVLNNRHSLESRVTLEATEEAIKDFMETAHSTAEWLNAKVQDSENNSQESWN